MKFVYIMLFVFLSWQYSYWQYSVNGYVTDTDGMSMENACISLM
jgi:hypothetical protein